MIDILKYISPQISAEIRGWLTIGLSILAFYISYSTYLNNQKQRRLENSFKLISLFKESLQENDIEMWKNIFLASSSESLGVKEGYFAMYDYQFNYAFPIIARNKPDNLVKEEAIDCEDQPYEEPYGIRQFPFSNLFSEGALDNGSIQRIAESLDLISFEMLNKVVDEQLIYFELGQLMDTIQLWLSFIDNPYSNKSFLQENFPYFYILYQTRIIQKSWKTRTYISLF